MIQKFDEFESLNEKWGMEYIIPLLISMGVVSQGQAQNLTPKEVDRIIDENPRVMQELNKDSIDNSINQLRELNSALRFLKDLDSYKEQDIMKKIQNTNMDESLATKLTNIVKGSGIYNHPDFGTFINLWVNLDKSTSINYGTGPFGKTLGIKKTF